ncbi:choline kinase [Trichomonascus vanleenenianus]|uniref:bifunctional choline kinase/ethanolamine kinase CKI1 n=1 Tax=Trichomonascus vanleenenianus TaxID=2268995 RepID=UPI003ECABBAF
MVAREIVSPAKPKKPVRRLSNQGAVTFASLPTTPLSVATGGSSSERTEGEEAGQFADVRHVKFFLDNRLPALYFKQDILRLIHSLKITRWKRVDMAMAADLQIKRMSGAMTNAIYAVEPPAYLKEVIKAAFASDPKHLLAPGKTYHHWMPSKVLLRVYGSQVDHLIDRDVELSVLQRLARKEIGPKLLGTFSNGRFEQFLDAVALTKHELRKPDISAQIAKRMRELHDNIELLASERDQGPAVWRNLSRWFDRAAIVLNRLEARDPGATARILQSDFASFRAMVAKYRKWITQQYGGEEEVRKELVFCHNDAQYGNILRFTPPPGSPLLHPQHEHRQLVVIDFEYSAANMRGYDIANHFSEWTYDYHSDQAHHSRDEWYPSPQDQTNFVQSYVEHGMDSFDDEVITRQTEFLLRQTLHWRAAVSANWCIWGIVQAVIDETEEMKEREEKDEEQGYRFSDNTSDKSPTLEEPEVVDEGDEFDYLAYATEKAQLFWTDMINLGLINESDYKGVLRTIAH